MLRRGEQRPFFRDRSRPAAPRPNAPIPVRFSFMGKVLRGALVVILAVGLLPMTPAAMGVDRAEALEGTTNYSDFFNFQQINGTPGQYLGNSTFLVASTAAVSDYGSVANSANSNRSAANLRSKNEVSLLCDWTLSFSVWLPALLTGSTVNSANCSADVMLSVSGSDPLGSKGIMGSFKVRGSGSSQEVVLQEEAYPSDGKVDSDTVLSGFRTGQWVACTVAYSYAGNTLTISVPGASKTIASVRSKVNNQSNAYLYCGGHIAWFGKSGRVPPPQTDRRVSFLFSKIELPRFVPTITKVEAFDDSKSSTVPVGKNDAVTPNSYLRVVATLKNTHAQAGSQTFDMHFRPVNTVAHPTTGVEVVVDGSHPQKVYRGSTLVSTATSATEETVKGAKGAKLSLVGSQETKVEFYVRVNQVSGVAAVLSTLMTDDSFNGESYDMLELLSERTLTPDPETGTGTAGKDYHYSRHPASNANGWNNTPVSVTFFPGDFDQLTLTPGGGSASTLTGASSEWKRDADTSGITVALRASNSSTGAVSTTGSESIKIDTAKPTLSVNPALNALIINDKSADASKATSGVWRLYRTGADGSISVRAAAKVFPLTSGTGAATQTVASIANGYYVAEDAAGNLSDVFTVGSTEPPAVTRPPGSIVTPGDPNSPTPVGPPIDPDDKVPDPTVAVDDIGLKHSVISETVTQFLDAANPPFGGELTLDDAKALMAYRYQVDSTAEPVTTTVELLDTMGAPLTSLPTTAVGECLIRQVSTDAQGNTTTVNLTYRLIKDNCPLVRPWEPADPDDPNGPKVPGEAIEPDGPVTTDPDGTQHATLSCEATELVRKGAMGAAEAVDLLKRHFALTATDGADASVRTVLLATAGGAEVSSIDLATPADYLIAYEATDATGNSTTVKLTYHLVLSKAPAVTAHPDPGTNPNPQPGDDPLNPKPYPVDPMDPPWVDADGTHHAEVHDEMVVPVQEGASLSLADVRALMERRYTFATAVGVGVTERGLGLATADGAPAEAIDLSQPGEYVIRYEVADDEGNSTVVNLRYRVKDAEVEPPDEPTPPDTPKPPSVAVKPGGGGGDGSGDGSDGTPKPLPPTTTVVDPETGLAHATIEDTLTAGTSAEPMTPEAMAELFAQRYEVTSSQPDGQLSYGPVHLFDADGSAVEAIDRSAPGDWRAEQVITDSAGNATTIRVAYLVREGSVDGGIGDDGNGAGDGAGNGSGTAGNGSGDAGQGGSGDDNGSWLSRLTGLPQTGDLLARCPIHIMFVLLMVLASAYGLMRLRQEAARDRQRRQRDLDAVWEEELARFGEGAWQ